jgi:anion-transporting  ArsA/GET3 family ATPase
VAAHILFVTGKGGTGKSSVATSLARLAASRGRAVVLLRMRAAADGSPSAVPADDATAVDQAGHPATGRLPRLREVSLDDQRDLEQFLLRVLPLGFLARRLLDNRVPFTAGFALASPARRSGAAALADEGFGVLCH